MYNRVYHKEKETIGKMLTNGQTDGQCPTRVLLSFYYGELVHTALDT